MHSQNVDRACKMLTLLCTCTSEWQGCNHASMIAGKSVCNQQLWHDLFQGCLYYSITMPSMNVIVQGCMRWKTLVLFCLHYIIVHKSKFSRCHIIKSDLLSMTSLQLDMYWSLGIKFWRINYHSGHLSMDELGMSYYTYSYNIIAKMVYTHVYNNFYMHGHALVSTNNHSNGLSVVA
jgi:hypothetical protein